MNTSRTNAARKPGRPRSKGKAAPVYVRFPKDLDAEIRRAAELASRGLAAHIAVLCEYALQNGFEAGKR